MRPIDTTFLDRQTFGDRTLRDDILHLFVTQAQPMADELLLSVADGHGITIDLHRLKGSARAVGAACLANHIEAVERLLHPKDGCGVTSSDLVLAACATLLDQIRQACAQATELLGDVERRSRQTP